MKGNIRVRMAPSPTGLFHVGSARTALYNWLIARHYNGQFLLRVEDTDIERSSEDMIQVILDGLSWLGLTWDGKPVYQSKRRDLYQKYVNMLIERKQAYYCFCSPEDLDKEKQAAYRNKRDWRYDRRCLHLSDGEKEKKEKAGLPKAVRFLVPDQSITYNDIVHGMITREAKDVEDFVILRADGTPTYNLACIVDDYEMGITHVIRGADHITNTPKQIALYNALHIKPPEFAHLPLILGRDKSKLSKRHGAVSVTDYRDQGYIPEAIINYLALLGWSPGDNRELMNTTELVEHFSLERISSSNAVFDIDKMNWLNQQHIMQLNLADFEGRLTPFIINAGLTTAQELKQNSEWLREVCRLLQPRLRTLSDVNSQARYFFREDFEYEQEILKKSLNEQTLHIVKNFLPVLRTVEPFRKARIEAAVREYAQDSNIKAKQLIHPLRAFTTGTTAGPPLFETLELVGRDRCVTRLTNILNKYGSS